MKKSKMAVLLLVCMLATAILPASAAETNYCQRLVNGNQCGKLLHWFPAGRSIDYMESHEYGGVFGIGKSTCHYTYYYSYLERRCTDGHVAEATTLKMESGHTCGK